MVTKEEEASAEEVQFDDQAFLWDFIKVFNNKTRPKDGKKDEPVKYRNFIQLLDRFPSITSNRLYGKGANSLHSATTAQLSSLVPKFRLYKTLSDGKTEKNIEFPFTRFTTVDSITDSALGRGSDVGLMSVNWNDTGTNPFNVGVSFSGDISLKFNSFEALFKLRDSGGHGIAFAELLNPEEITGKKITQQSSEFWDQPTVSNIDDFKKSIKMVIGWELPHDPGNNLNLKDIEEDLQLLERTYILQNLDHSIDIDSGDASITVNIKFAARIEGMLLSTRTDLLYIDPANENEIDKKTRDSYEASKKSLLSKKKQMQEKAKDTKAKEQQSRYAELTFGEARSSNTNVDKEIEKINEELKSLNKKLKSNISESRAIAYKRLLTGLRSNIANPTPNSDGKVKYIDLPSTAFNEYLTVLQGAAKNKKDMKDLQKREKDQAEKTIEPSLNDANVSARDKERLKKSVAQHVRLKTEEFQEIYGAERSLDIERIGKVVKNAARKTGSGEGKWGALGPSLEKKTPTKKDAKYKPKFKILDKNGTRRIHYFYLGDLIDAVFDIIYKRPLTKNNKIDGKDQINDERVYKEIKMVLGPFVYYNPVTKESINMAMADIPVSFNYFNAWFFDNVIKQGLTNYTLRSFLRDLCSKLLNNVLSPTRFGPLNPTRSFVTRVQSVRVDKDSKLNQYWQKSYNFPKERINVEGLLRNMRQKAGGKKGSATIKQTEWIYLYTMGSSSDFLAKHKGNSAFNINNDIPHYYIGGQHGILKSVSFSRTNIPGKLEAALASGAEPTRKNLLFQNKYDAQVEIFGNPIFKPGMLIYLDPRGIGLGSIDTYGTPTSPTGVDFRYDLGIGGYYRVVNVTNAMSSGIFSTALTTTAELDLRDIRILNQKENA